MDSVPLDAAPVKQNQMHTSDVVPDHLDCSRASVIVEWLFHTERSSEARPCVKFSICYSPLCVVRLWSFDLSFQFFIPNSGRNDSGSRLLWWRMPLGQILAQPHRERFEAYTSSDSTISCQVQCWSDTFQEPRRERVYYQYESSK